MATYNVYCLGTGHSSNQAERLLPVIHGTYDRSPANQKQLMEGIGTSALVREVQAANDGKAPWIMEGRGQAFGKGWGDVVMKVMADLVAADGGRNLLTHVNLIGHSRGAVTCHMIAHAIAHRLSHVSCRIIAIDPVPGGVLDFSPSRELSENSRTKLGLDGKSPEVLPSNVALYLGIYMEKDTNLGFGVLGPRKLMCSPQTVAVFLPMYGKHGDCVKSDINQYPASRIALSIVLSLLNAFGTPVDRTKVLTEAGYADAYAELYLNAIESGANPKSVENYSELKVAGLVAATVLTGGLMGLVLAAGHCPSYWLNQRASDIPNDFRANPYYLNWHHRDMFLAVPDCRNVADCMDRQGFMSRRDFENFSNMHRRCYELLVRTGLARSLTDSATMTFDDRLIFRSGGETNIKKLEISPSSAQMRTLADQLNTQLVIAAAEPANAAISMDLREIFTLDAWKRATYVRIGSRGDQVAVIDQLLPEYHEYRRAQNQGATLRIACWLAEQAEQHLRTKRGSNRRKGMVQLAAQLVSRLQ